MKKLYILLALFLLSQSNVAAQEDSQLYMPLTYDSGIIDKAFSLDGDTTSLVERTLINMYLKHPELVRKTYHDIISHDTIKAEQVSMVKEVAKTHNDAQKATTEPIENEVVDMVITKPNFWTFLGDYSLQFMQNYLSTNWYKSGSSNYAMQAATTLQYNYNNKQRVKWDNKLEMKIGFQTTKADTLNNFKTTDDVIRYTSQLSLQAHKKWYYATQLIASTQFTHGLKDNDKTIYSDFMSPFNLNLSLGMNYIVDTSNKRLTGNIILAPVSYKMTYVDRLELATRFGVKEGKHTQHDFGSLINADIVWKPLNNIKWESRLYLYTTYHKLQMEWENTISFQFNRYISTKLSIYPRFDDAAEKISSTYWQMKEDLSIGFAYSM